MKLWLKTPTENSIWSKLVETLNFTIWIKIIDVKLSKPTFPLFKVSLPQLIFTKKVYSFKLILFQDVFNKILFLITFSIFKKKDGEKIKSKMKSSESQLLLIMVTTESIRSQIWTLTKILNNTYKSTMHHNPWWITTKKAIISPSKTVNNHYSSIKENLVQKMTNKSKKCIWFLNYVNLLVSLMNKKMTQDSSKNSLDTLNLMLKLDSLESMTTLKRFKVFSVKTKTMLA